MPARKPAVNASAYVRKLCDQRLQHLKKLVHSLRQIENLWENPDVVEPIRLECERVLAEIQGGAQVHWGNAEVRQAMEQLGFFGGSSLPQREHLSAIANY